MGKTMLIAGTLSFLAAVLMSRAAGVGDPPRGRLLEAQAAPAASR